MLYTINTSVWQILNAAKRKAVSTGKELRVTPSRFTKDGTFLNDLVTKGFLAIVEPHENPFKATYKITPEGEYAAEYGEYDAEPKTHNAKKLNTTPEQQTLEKINTLLNTNKIRIAKNNKDPLTNTYAFVIPNNE